VTYILNGNISMSTRAIGNLVHRVKASAFSNFEIDSNHNTRCFCWVSLQKQCHSGITATETWRCSMSEMQWPR